MAQQPDQIDSRIVDLPGGKGRILCIADIRGDIEQLNRLVRETGAVACIHTGDFGFYEAQSIERISDKTLKHLITYSPTIPPALRNKLLAPQLPRKDLLHALSPNRDDFHLSQFPLLFGSTPRLKLIVPTFAVYGACEDVRVVEKFRTGEYKIPNLTVLDEATTRAVDVGGVRLRLLGLGGAVVMAKMFDNGEGNATIAGGQGTMWTTALQIGELIDTAQRVYDPTETRLLITHSSIGREPLLALLSLALKADLTISSGLHFRYGASWNEFSVQDDGGASWWGKVTRGKKRWEEVWEMVRGQVEAAIEPSQKVYLDKTLSAFARSPPQGAHGPTAEESAWKNTWSWNLTDSTFGQLLLDVEDGRVSSEMRSQGFNFSHRRAASASVTSASASTPAAARFPPASSPLNAPRGPAAASAAPPSQPTGLAVPRNASLPNAPTGPAKGRKTPVVPAQPSPAASTPPSAPSPAGPASTNGGPPKIELKPLAGANNHKKNESSSSSQKAPAKVDTKQGAAATVPAASSSPAPSNGQDSTPPTPSSAAPPVSSKKVTSAERKDAARHPFTAFVSNLPVPTSERELREYFADAQEGVVTVRFIFGPNGEQKKFAYVSFSDQAALDKGIATSQATQRQIKSASPKVVVSDPALGAGPGANGSGSGSDWGGSTRGRGRGGRGRGAGVGSAKSVSRAGATTPKGEGAATNVPAAAAGGASEKKE